MTCIFCDRIAHGEYEETTVPSVVMFEPLNPVVAGHLLFVPRCHAVSAAEHPIGAGTAVLAAAEHLRRIGGDANIITSVGPEATQTIWHTHVHLVPRHEGDGLTLPWTGQEK